ncbi:type II 3-dehydroquinate dehydratase [Aquipuribacter sp. SD81]|uniref:type II 3-dehydroquinate dehydratase n=1 Tax=Aquipuribacter sp. SD81 TaxID=3127703 RepID=UPI00301AE42D
MSPGPTRVLVLSGPNLGRLGSREPDVYGSTDHDGLVRLVHATAEQLGLDVDVRQSDDEADLVHWLHEAVDTGRHVVVNPAAFTHYSYALRDAAALVTGAGLLLVEVHISNPHGREAFRRHSVVSPVASGVVAGFGLDSYTLALQAVARRAG